MHEVAADRVPRPGDAVVDVGRRDSRVVLRDLRRERVVGRQRREHRRRAGGTRGVPCSTLEEAARRQPAVDVGVEELQDFGGKFVGVPACHGVWLQRSNSRAMSSYDASLAAGS